MLFIEAFSNMKIYNILDFLQPIITDHNRSRHIRLVAIWAAKSATTTHPDKVYTSFHIYLNIYHYIYAIYLFINRSTIIMHIMYIPIIIIILTRSGCRGLLADIDQPFRTNGNSDVCVEHAHDVPTNRISVLDAILVHASGTEPADL